ncbi:MAG: alpha/beta hydrolase [Gemmatimonadales bacterium]
MLRYLFVSWVLFATQAEAQKADTVNVEVDSATMRMVISGTGKTTIVLEAGAAADMRTWSKVHPELSRYARVVSYDRLGYGSSHPARRPRTAAIMAEQLHAGLQRAGIAPPFIVVAHSFGGIIARVFASQYPSEVVALVLVDPALEQFYVRATLNASHAYLRQIEEDLVWAENSKNESVRREYLGYETSLLEARVAVLPRGLPITLLSATKMELDPALLAIWVDEQTRWSKSVGARQIFVEYGHRIPQGRPDVVIDAVKRVLLSIDQTANTR